MRKRAIRGLLWGTRRRKPRNPSAPTRELVARHPPAKVTAANPTTENTPAGHNANHVPTTSDTGTAPSKRRGWRWVAATLLNVGLILLLVGVAGCTTHPGGLSPAAGSPTRTSATVGTSSSTTPTTSVTNTVPTTTRPAPGTTQAAGATSPSLSNDCRSGTPLANVYHPYRLQVRIACVSVTGTVASVRHEADGDDHINLSLPATEEHLLNQHNMSTEHSDLVTEVVPADEPGCTLGHPPPLPPSAYTTPGYTYGICTGADIQVPVVGEQVTVTGPYVLDTDHGWMEVHPVWSIAVRGTTTGSGTTTTTTAPSSTTIASPSGCYPTTSSGNCYKAGEFCRTATAGRTGVAATGGRIVCETHDGLRWEPAT